MQLLLVRGLCVSVGRRIVAEVLRYTVGGLQERCRKGDEQDGNIGSFHRSITLTSLIRRPCHSVDCGASQLVPASTR